ncbi:GrpB family protein [Ornithinibacillus contaminans]|uniref:GrpB family protein n=1 Tax=Ornithinibacillus contaminans TaxID=694055 RepID=UPI00064DDB87|nr:GrpB family protein [Ornithinibacillus contaminans]
MKVRLTEFNDKWSQMFHDEVQNLKTIFGEEIIRCEHFGSTSVPGMKAKPVIDMMCIFKDIEKVDLFNSKMQSLGYDVAGEWGITGRRFFRKGGENRTHHIHCYQFDNPEIERHLIFRDYLRTHPEEVIRYSNFKEELAQRYEDTNEYSPAKKDFVEEMEQRAIHWFGEVLREQKRHEN